LTATKTDTTKFWLTVCISYISLAHCISYVTGNRSNRLLFQNELDARKVDAVITVVGNRNFIKEYKSSLLSRQILWFVST